MTKPAASKKPAKSAGPKKIEPAKPVKAAAAPVVARPESGDCPAPAKPAPAAAAKTARLAFPKPSATPVTVVVRYDAGWGNMLHLRGEGPGLSWDVGAPMCCVKDNEWVWVAPTPGTVSFKVLHNDNAWSLGENIIAAPGETVTVTPTF